MTDDQMSLFGASAKTVQPASPSDDVRDVAGELPDGLFLGTSSWSFPGWKDIVWDRAHTEKALAREGLAAYAQHPLLNGVGVDRTHYGPLEAAAFAQYAEQVPDDFRFLVKAHEACTIHTWPKHARYGERRGQANAAYLDPDYATDVVVGPTVEGLGDRLFTLLFQFAPQDLTRLGGPERFAEHLHRFLDALPKGPLYSVEVRNPQLLSDAYREALLAAGASHCLNAIAGMPTLREQVQRVQKAVGPAVVIRWMLRRAFSYEEAFQRYRPFTHIVDRDDETRAHVADIVLHGLATGRQAMVIANNKAEGCAPMTLLEAAHLIAERRARAPLETA
jgi:uncharacterized protein YecE (DUF72 family)